MALALVTVAGCSPAQAPASALANALVGSAAPDLGGPQLNGAGEIDLQSLTGKPTAVIFWFAQCPHCQETLPALDAAWSAVEDDANVLTVGMPHPESDVETTAGFESPEDFVATTGLSLPTILGDWERSVAAWRLEGVPTVFLLDADHTVRRVLVGPDAAAIIDAVGDL
jgi:peroxiredoxin